MGKKGKKGKTKEIPIGLPFNTDEKLTDVTLISETLERELVGKEDECGEVMKREQDMRDKVEQMEEDYRQEQLTTYAVTADMVRQYKALQEDLIHKINSLETTLTEQKEELDMTDHELRELIKDKDEEIAAKDNTIIELKSRMDEMAVEFADMLKTTLSLMQDHMAAKLTPEQNKESSQQNYAQRLQEYSVRTGAAIKSNLDA
eukprot:GEMP01051560.1.p1 GENE.GEMP01051560.1~~GEMP01051560.1.p1  ORF type:complete len:203 (+),score=54.91 GEMP01051560.1:50-658(+)